MSGKAVKSFRQEPRLRAYRRKGGKRNRALQSRRIEAFLDFCERTMGVTSPGRIGARHVRAYWDTLADRAPATRYHHWLALCHWWDMFDKPGKPPQPPGSEETVSEALTQILSDNAMRD